MVVLSRPPRSGPERGGVRITGPMRMTPPGLENVGSQFLSLRQPVRLLHSPRTSERA
jgi:hypothetical protein